MRQYPECVYDVGAKCCKRCNLRKSSLFHFIRTITVSLIMQKNCNQTKSKKMKKLKKSFFRILNVKSNLDFSFYNKLIMIFIPLRKFSFWFRFFFILLFFCGSFFYNLQNCFCNYICFNPRFILFINYSRFDFI